MSNTTARYHGDWTKFDDILKEYPLCGLRDEEVLFACYDGGGYDGYARILFQRNGTLYEQVESHCSCNGLENWEPEPVTWEQLAMRKRDGYFYDAAVESAWHALIEAHTAHG